MSAGVEERRRLDVELVRRGLARSRRQAAELVAAGHVVVDGRASGKASLQVDEGSDITVAAYDEQPYVGRGALKLRDALEDLGGDAAVPVAGRRCLDAGASTGGFTQLLLELGAAHVHAVDVGRDQLAAALRDDPRVDDRSQTDVRDLTVEDLGGPMGLVVADLSFISVAHVLSHLAALAEPGADLLVLVKPQFEVGRRRIGAGGVVRDPALREQTLLAALRTAGEMGLDVRGAVASRWPGPSGNVEYFLHARVPEPVEPDEAAAAAALVAPGGPAGPVEPAEPVEPVEAHEPAGRDTATLLEGDRLAEMAARAVREGPQ